MKKYLSNYGRNSENKVEVSFKQDNGSIGEVALFASDGLDKKQNIRHGPIHSGPAKKNDHKKEFPQARNGGTRQQEGLHVGHSEFCSKRVVENLALASVKTQVGSLDHPLSGCRSRGSLKFWKRKARGNEMEGNSAPTLSCLSETNGQDVAAKGAEGKGNHDSGYALHDQDANIDCLLAEATNSHEPLKLELTGA